MVSSIGLVIFDCDGVLVDSERINVGVDVSVLAELGWPLTYDEVAERFLGRSETDMVADIEAHLGHRLPADWGDAYQARYLEALTGLQPVDGVVEALDRIDLPTCVASSGGHDKMRRTLGATGLWDRFAGRIVSATEVAHGKPAPDLFLLAARRMGVPPTACAVVEDSPYGVQAARAAGMRAFGYAGGVTTADRLRGPGTVVFDHMRDLPELLTASTGAG